MGRAIAHDAVLRNLLKKSFAEVFRQKRYYGSCR